MSLTDRYRNSHESRVEIGREEYRKKDDDCRFNAALGRWEKGPFVMVSSTYRRVFKPFPFLFRRVCGPKQRYTEPNRIIGKLYVDFAPHKDGYEHEISVKEKP